MNRRDFMKTGLMAGAVTSLAAPRASGRTAAASDRLRIGFLGCGARAHQLMDAVAATPNTVVVALADAYTGRAERARVRTGGDATIHPDYRAILDRQDVDAVFIVTPDHWHRPMALDAIAAGKDVYLEKPMTYTVEDGLEILAALKRSNRVLQVGSQGVSGAGLARARDLIRSGRLGQVTMVRAAYNRNSASGAWLYPIPPDAGPATVNWEQFLGPAQKRPFDLERFFRWRCYWDYSGGVATDLFVHLVSWLHYALDLKMPRSVVATGATYRWKALEVPDTVNALLQYPEGLTVNLCCTFNNAEGAESGLEILGTKGSLLVRGDTISFKAEEAREDNRWVVRSWPQALERAYYDDPKIQAVESPWLADQRIVADGESWQVSGRDDTEAHVGGFADCVRARKQPVEDALFGHRAAACAHMVNRSIREAKVVEWDFAGEKMT